MHRFCNQNNSITDPCSLS